MPTQIATWCHLILMRTLWNSISTPRWRPRLKAKTRAKLLKLVQNSPTKMGLNFVDGLTCATLLSTRHTKVEAAKTRTKTMMGSSRKTDTTISTKTGTLYCAPKQPQTRQARREISTISNRAIIQIDIVHTKHRDPMEQTRNWRVSRPVLRSHQ